MKGRCPTIPAHLVRAFGEVHAQTRFAILIAPIFLRPALGSLLTMVWRVLLLLAMLLESFAANNPNSITGEPVFGGLTVREAFKFLWTQQPLFTFPILFVSWLSLLTSPLGEPGERPQNRP